MAEEGATGVLHAVSKDPVTKELPPDTEYGKIELGLGGRFKVAIKHGHRYDTATRSAEYVAVYAEGTLVYIPTD